MAAKESRAGAVSGPSAGEPGARCISRFSTGRAGTATRVRRPRGTLSRAVPTTARVLVPWAAQVRAQGGHGHRSADPRSSPPARPSPSFHGAVGSRWGSAALQARPQGLSSHEAGGSHSPPCPESGSPENGTRVGLCCKEARRAAPRPGSRDRPRPAALREGGSGGRRWQGTPQHTHGQLAGGHAAACVLPSTLSSSRHGEG